MSMSNLEIQAVYRRHAHRYDSYVKLYRLIGFRYESYRSRAIELLGLRRGDLVVDLGCGTGLNFPHLVERIGPEGRLIGVDLSPEMLACARERLDRAGWTNAELVQSDMATYDFPIGVDKVISSGALGYVAEYDSVIKKAGQALVPGGRLVIWDIKQPENWWFKSFKLVLWLGRPFGVTSDYFQGQPWKSVERYLNDATFEQWYGGAVYIASGSAPPYAA